MKFFYGIAASLLLCAAQTASLAPAQVYLLDPETSRHTPEHQTVSPETARLIFAERLGLSRFHTLQNDEEALRHVNTFGGRTPELFEDEHGSRSGRAHLMVVLEGVSDDQDIVGPQRTPHFAISSPPDTTSNERFLADLAAQAEHLLHGGYGPRESVETPHLEDLRGALKLPDKAFTTRSGVNLFHIKDLARIAQAHGRKSTEYQHEAKRLSQVVSEAIFHAKADGIALTLVLMPPSEPKSKKSTSPYGTYETPSTRPKAQRQFADPVALAQPSISINVDVTSGIPHTLANHTAPRGILPPCFSSLSACENATNNCTGRGSCRLKYTNKDQNDAKCYACMCKATVRTNQSGSKKTTRWGGPACQKKDVTAPFWLLAGLTVLLVFVVGWGIGLLYSMGQEDLPSVIGAGVSGPRATK